MSVSRSLTIAEIVSTANWIARTAQRCENQHQVTAAELDEIAKLLKQAEALIGKAQSKPEVHRA